MTQNERETGKDREGREGKRGGEGVKEMRERERERNSLILVEFLGASLSGLRITSSRWMSTSLCITPMTRR